MRYKIIVSHEIEGTKRISPPGGWKGAVLGFERHPKLKSILRYFRSAFNAYGSNGVEDGGKAWFLNVEKLYGVNAQINLIVKVSENNLFPDGLLDDTFDDALGFKTVFSGQVPIISFIEMMGSLTHDLQIAFNESDFWTKFINRFDIPVNLLGDKDQDGNTIAPGSSILINLPSQPINKTTKYTGHSGNADTAEDCFVVTDSNIILSGHQIVNGVLTTENMRVLVAAQTDAKENGIYDASFLGWSRSIDANTDTEIQFLIVKVTHGDTGVGTYRQTNETAVLGVDDLTIIPYDYVSHYELFTINESMPDSGSSQTITKYTSATQDTNQKEIEDSFSLVYTTFDDVEQVGNQLEIRSERGSITIAGDIRNRFKIEGTAIGIGIKALTSIDVITELYVRVNNETAVLVGSNTASRSAGLFINNNWDTFISAFTTDINVVPSDLVTIYLKHSFVFNFIGGDDSLVPIDVIIYGGLLYTNLINAVFKSNTNDSQADGFLIHDAGSYIAEKLTGQSQPIYSEYLGSPDTVVRTYLGRGCFADYATLKGLQARGYSLPDKPNSMSMKDWFEGIDAHADIGIGLEEKDGQPILRVEKGDYFFDSSDVSTNLSNVRRIKRDYDLDHMYDQAKVGSETWQSPDIQGSLDDPQSNRTYANILKNIGKTFTALSKMISASLAFERTRRATVQKSTAFQYDNNDFLLSVKKVGSIFQPKFNERFQSTTGLNDEDKRYNKDLTPARAFLRWRKYLSACLFQYPSSEYTFNGGEGNYDMESIMYAGPCPDSYGGQALSEKQNIPVTKPLFISVVYEIEHYLTLDQFMAIDNNRHLAIGISQTDVDHKKFFIKDLQWEMNTGLLKLKAWPIEFFDILDIDDGGNEFGESTGHSPGRVFDSTFGVPFA